MMIETVDLYSYFNIDKPDNAKGILTCYTWAVSSEMEGDNRIRPAMLILPGGGYSFVSDRENEPVALTYMQHGFNCFVLDYSVYPNCFYPTQLREGAMAMIYIRENAEKFHIYKDQVSAIGFSAGGHLCGMLGSKFNCDEVRDLRNHQFIRPDALILSYPVTICENDLNSHMGSFINLTNNHADDNADKLSLDKILTKDSSPAFIWHTFADSVVPVEGTIRLVNRYNQLKVPCELHIFQGGEHGASIATDEVNTNYFNLKEWVNLSLKWLSYQGFKIYS